jgi:cytoskeletal protein CcmA (bactofilin family)
VRGNLTASEKVDIREKGSVEGDIVAPRVAIADGAEFRGSVDMRRKESAAGGEWPVDVRPDVRTPASANGEPVSV